MASRIIVVAPHPDDEVLGCGGTIARLVRKGHAVYVCIVTKAYTPEWTEKDMMARHQEVIKVRDLLGISRVIFLDLPTVKLDTVPQKDLNQKIASVMEDIRPDIVFLPFGGDLNKDHRLIFEASLVATRSIGTSILCYETLSEAEWGLGKSFVPTVYVDITAMLHLKLEAMKLYRSELKRFSHSRSLEAIKALARLRGSTVGFEAAEAFSLVRSKL